MRSFQVVEQRWSSLFDTSIGVDLRQAIRDESSLDPCEDGLRSVCWRAFLSYGPLSKASWTKKLAESRSGYLSLRDHFLKYINNPNDLHSSVDPLADDERSPWSSLRQDEVSREEIFQDVTRCMQDNYFFREPTTQKKLLDILFIYSKLNPDTGYRQGMHELLAPILWVISQDAVDISRVPQSAKAKEGTDFMLEILDQKYIEHDAFNLFCAVMQTAKSFYEMDEKKDSSAIVAQSDRIHNELLTAVDPDLAHHLQVLGVLPQIYSIRWIRLLFGREFDFKDVLKMWDLLFAENLTIDVINMTCVAMLLRHHWQLIDADYTSAITRLNRFELPQRQENPRTLVRDAVLLNRSRTLETGASIIEQYSGQRPQYANTADHSSGNSGLVQSRQSQKRWSRPQDSPTRSPARFSTPQKQLENIFQEVSGNLQRRTEGWSVSKAVRGAVGEVRKNMNSLQTTHSRGPSVETGFQSAPDTIATLHERINILETRQRVLSTMLDGALNSLRACKPGSTAGTTSGEDVFNMALARLQFVSVYLSDSDIPLPSGADTPVQTFEDAVDTHATTDRSKTSDSGAKEEESEQTTTQVTTDEKTESQSSDKADETSTVPSVVKAPLLRPSLAESSFSFMLGENRHRSSFVSSVSTLPEQHRDSTSRSRPKQIAADAVDKRERRGSKDKNAKKATPPEDHGITLSSFQ